MYAINRQHAHNILFYVAVAAVAFTLKSHYSRAGADDLFWILAPTAFLVEIVSGIEFTPESGAGYFSPGHRYLIAPACAGVNFLIVAFCMTAFAGVHRLNSPLRKSVWIIFSGVAALGTTLAVNTPRIIFSIHLYGADIYSGALTPERLHRAGGIAVYFLFLHLLFAAISRVLDLRWPRYDSSGRLGSLFSLWPLFWYLAFSIGVPLLNQAYRKAPDRFPEHALMVLTMSIAMVLGARGIQGACQAALKRLRSGSSATA